MGLEEAKNALYKKEQEVEERKKDLGIASKIINFETEMDHKGR